MVVAQNPQYGLPVAVIKKCGTGVPTAEPPATGLTGTLENQKITLQ